MEKNNKILGFNLNSKEIEIIKEISKEVGFNIEIENTEIIQDLIVKPSFLLIIKNNEIYNESIDEIIKFNKDWINYIVINGTTFSDKDKLLKIIIDAYYDYNNHIIEDEIKSKNGIIGFAIGDALGVPAEFRTREELNKNPIKQMEEYMTHNQPKGTWSDDTSMTLATMGSIIEKKKIDLNDIIHKFLNWYRKNEYTANNNIFDIGITTREALMKYELLQCNPNECGGNKEFDNGNGSLMRMLPIAYYIYFKNIKSSYEIFKIVKEISSITHRHDISILGCYIYVIFCVEILNGKTKKQSYINIKNFDYSMFDAKTLQNYDRILKTNIYEFDKSEIKSTAFIVHTLEAALWVFLNSSEFDKSILEAVNLGEDTDTIAACTGGLLGIYYGIDNIDIKFKNDLKRKNYIYDICEQFDKNVNTDKY